MGEQFLLGMTLVDIDAMITVVHPSLTVLKGSMPHTGRHLASRSLKQRFQMQRDI